MINERVSGHPMIWWGLLCAPLVYVGILLFVLPARPLATDLTLPAVLASIGVVQALAAQVLWVQVKRGAFAGKTNAAGEPLPMPVIVWALDESAAAIGLVVAILGAPQTWSFALIGVSIVALLLNPYWTLEEEA